MLPKANCSGKLKMSSNPLMSETKRLFRILVSGADILLSLKF